MNRHGFFDFFPPPIFLKMPATGLSVDDDVLRIVHFEKKNRRQYLRSAKEFILDTGTFINGEIAKPDKFLLVLKKIRSEHGVRFVRVALPEEKAYVYETTIPLPEDGELRDAVEFSLEQNIPLAPAETLFDFSVTEEPFVHNEVLSVKVAVSAYPSSLPESLVGLLNQAGIIPLAMTSESQALAHSLMVRGDIRSVMLVHFLRNKTVIAIVSGGVVRFSTTVSSNIDNHDKILESHEGERIVESIELLSVRDEVKKVYSYWMSKEKAQSQKEPKSIKSVIVTGHVGGMLDVAEYLGKHIGVPVVLGNVWLNAFSLDNYIPEIEFENSLQYAVAVGVALIN